MKEEYERQLQEQISINEQLRQKLKHFESQQVKTSEVNHSEVVLFQPKEFISQYIQTDEEAKSDTTVEFVD
jgi:hypothetical protein